MNADPEPADLLLNLPLIGVSPADCDQNYFLPSTGFHSLPQVTVRVWRVVELGRRSKWSVISETLPRNVDPESPKFRTVLTALDDCGSGIIVLCWSRRAPVLILALAPLTDSGSAKDGAAICGVITWPRIMYQSKMRTAFPVPSAKPPKSLI